MCPNYRSLSTQLGGEKDFDRKRVVFSNDSNAENAILTIEHVNTNDSNGYSCIVRNEASVNGKYLEARTQTMVVVKGNYFNW